MNANIKVLLCSIVVGIVYIIYNISQPIPCDGWSAISQGLGSLELVVVISIVFGISGFLFTKLDTSWGKRFIRALSWFGISLIVILPITIMGLKLASPGRNAEWDKRCPRTQNYDKNAPNYQAPKP